ncbi:hypothetical protein AU476_12185 [Cupriavidus sp. UYMSc13B]|nr:hypothetical protein AU476_12185 [Cupriavidus sp. UYMSc13B]
MATLVITTSPAAANLLPPPRARAGGQWVFGWIPPFVPSSPLPLGTVINFYEINYSFYADQMNNQFQNIDIRNTRARNDGRLI